MLRLIWRRILERIDRSESPRPHALAVAL